MAEVILSEKSHSGTRVNATNGYKFSQLSISLKANLNIYLCAQKNIYLPIGKKILIIGLRFTM